MDRLNRRVWLKRAGLFVPALFAIGRSKADTLAAGPITRTIASGSQYFYPYSYGESDFSSTTALTSSFRVGSVLTCGTTGTCTKIGAKLNNANAAINIRLCLYAADDTSLAGGTVQSPASASTQWVDVTINQAVTAATVYQLIWVPESALSGGIEISSEGVYTSDAYGGSCLASNPAANPAFCIGVRMYV